MGNPCAVKRLLTLTCTEVIPNPTVSRKAWQPGLKICKSNQAGNNYHNLHHFGPGESLQRRKGKAEDKVAAEAEK